MLFFSDASDGIVNALTSLTFSCQDRAAQNVQTLLFASHLTTAAYQINAKLPDATIYIVFSNCANPVKNVSVAVASSAAAACAAVGNGPSLCASQLGASCSVRSLAQEFRPPLIEGVQRRGGRGSERDFLAATVVGLAFCGYVVFLALLAVALRRWVR